MIECCYINLLETSTVTLSQGSANPSYPLYRLYDRDIGRMFAGAAAATVQVHVDQGAANQIAIDSLFIPAGHNLSGVWCALYWSDDSVNWTQVLTFTPTWSGLIWYNFGPLTHRYWAFTMEASVAAPQLAELFLTATYTWEKLPARPGGPFDDVFNVKTDVTSSGLDRFLIFGASKRQRVYKVLTAGTTQEANITALNTAWAGAMPFWLYDHEGNWIYGKLAKPLNLKERAAGIFEFDFNFLEVLG